LNFKQYLLCRLFLALFFIWVLSACSQNSEKISGGGGTETTNGGMGGVALLQNGKPAVLARVILRSTSAVDNSTLATEVYTDSSGQWQIDLFNPGDYTLELIADNKMTAMRRSTLPSANSRNNLGLIRLEPPTHLQGSVQCGDQCASVYLKLRGLDRVTQPDSTGAYIFSDIPLGLHLIEVSGEAFIQNLFIANTSAAPLDVDITNAQPFILLESFNIRDWYHNYASFIFGGWWYVHYSDDAELIAPQQGENEAEQFLVFDEPGQGYFSCSLYVDPDSIGWAGIGMDFRSGGYHQDWIDFSSMTALRFKVRGNGLLNIGLSLRSPESRLKESVVFASVDLNPDWTEIELSLQDFEISEKDSLLHLPDAFKYAEGLVFQGHTSMSFDLDDLFIMGVSPDKLLYSDF
jgi:hypothetical protein